MNVSGRAWGAAASNALGGHARVSRGEPSAVRYRAVRILPNDRLPSAILSTTLLLWLEGPAGYSEAHARLQRRPQDKRATVGLARAPEATPLNLRFQGP